MLTIFNFELLKKGGKSEIQAQMPKSMEGRNSRKEKSWTQEVDGEAKAVARGGVRNQQDCSQGLGFGFLPEQ